MSWPPSRPHTRSQGIPPQPDELPPFRTFQSNPISDSGNMAQQNNDEQINENIVSSDDFQAFQQQLQQDMHQMQLDFQQQMQLQIQQIQQTLATLNPAPPPPVGQNVASTSQNPIVTTNTNTIPMNNTNTTVIARAGILKSLPPPRQIHRQRTRVK